MKNFIKNLIKISLVTGTFIIALAPLAFGQVALPYVMDTNGTSKLYVYPVDNSTYKTWGVRGAYTGARSTTDGSANTIMIGGNSTYAAGLCSNLNALGYDDWYLPAKDQLNVMWTQRNSTTLTSYPGWTVFATGLSAGLYWSSTEYSEFNAWRKNLGSTIFDGVTDNSMSGRGDFNSKSDGWRVRCVRSGPSDSIAPTSNAALVGTAGTNSWFTSNVSATVTAVDESGGSGVKESRVCADKINTCTPTIGNSINITSIGTNYFRYQSIDNAGNLETVRSSIVKIDRNLPSTTASVSDSDLDGILDSATVTLTSTDDDSGVASIRTILNGGATIVTSGNTATVTLVNGSNSLQYLAVDNAGNSENPVTNNYTYPDNCPALANTDQADLDIDGIGDACDPDIDNDGTINATDAFPLDSAEWLDTDVDGVGNNADTDDDNDGIEDLVDTNPLVISSDFSDGSTFGNINTTGGWTVSVTDLPDLAGVRISVVGAGTIAKFITCNNSVETQLDTNGETADITCGSTNVTAVMTNQSITIREPGSNVLGKAVKVRLTTGQSVKMGSYILASANNTEPIFVEIVDENELVLGSGSLTSGQNIDVNLEGPNNTVVIENLGTSKVSFNMDGATLELIPGERFSDLCPNSVADISPLENRFAWLGGTNFMTKDPKTKQLIGSPYSVNKTRGCSCDQILASTVGQEKGQVSKGCTKETLETFIKNNVLAQGGSVLAKVGSFFSVIGKGITTFASVLTSFLYR